MTFLEWQLTQTNSKRLDLCLDHFRPRIRKLKTVEWNCVSVIESNRVIDGGLIKVIHRKRESRVINLTPVLHLYSLLLDSV